MESFKQFVESSNQVKPISVIDKALAEQFATTINNAHENKGIYNVDLKDVKEKINRQYDRWSSGDQRGNLADKAKGDNYDPATGRDGMEYPELWDLWWDTPHNFTQVSKFIRNAKKLSSKHKFLKDVISVYEEFDTYAKSIKALKPYIIKGRKPNPDMVSKEVFQPAMLNTKALKLVTDTLNKIVDDEYKKLINGLMERNDDVVDNYLNKRKDNESPYKFYAKQAGSRDIARRLIKDASPTTQPTQMIDPVKVDNYDEISKGIATNQANELRERFLIKNIEKIGSVIYKKNSPIKTTKASGHMDGFGFNGEIAFKFEDGTGFNVRNKAVMVFNGWSDSFFRFPTTFHDVVFPDGKKRKMLSQEEMNKEWSVV